MTNASRSLPPGPPLPAWAQRLAFALLPLHFERACQHRYGQLATVRGLGDGKSVMVFAPDLVRQVHRASSEQLDAGQANAVLAGVLGERSIFVLDGAENVRQRRLQGRQFHGKRLRSYEAAIRTVTDRAIDSWPVGEPFPLLDSMRSLTLEVMVSPVLGVASGARAAALTRRLESLRAPVPGRLAMLGFTISGGRICRQVQARLGERRRLSDRLLYEQIRQRRAAPDVELRQDVLSTLVAARDEHGKAMTDREVRDQLVTLLIAGHATTAVALTWTLELLLRHPEVLSRLRAALAGGDADYLDAVIKEALRIRPVVAGRIGGRTVGHRPLDLGGYLLPPGTEVRPAMAAVHRRPDRYPEPDAFRPERFLKPEARDASAWMPFGGGPRRCLGASFAAFEMAVVIRRVLERADLVAVGRRPERPAARRNVFEPRRGGRVIQRRAPRPATEGALDPLAELERPFANRLEVRDESLLGRIHARPELHRALPLGLAVGLARARGRLEWLAFPPARRSALARAAGLAGPGASRAQVRRLARQHLMELAIQTELSWHPRAAQQMPLSGLEHLEGARAGGRGAILATVHMGPMINLGHALAARGHPPYGCGWVTPSDSPLSGDGGRWWKTQMHWIETSGCRWLGRGGTYPLLRALLERGELCWLNWDLRGHSSVPVRLLGRPFEVGRGVGRLALETGAHVVPGFTWREGNGQVGALFAGIDPGDVTDEQDLNSRLAAAVEQALAPRLAQAHRGLAQRLAG